MSTVQSPNQPVVNRAGQVMGNIPTLSYFQERLAVEQVEVEQLQKIVSLMQAHPECEELLTLAWSLMNMG